MKLTTEYLNDSVKGLIPNAKEVEVESADGKRLPIDKLVWTMELNEGEEYHTAKLIIILKEN